MIDYNTPVVIIIYFILYLLFSFLYFKYSFKKSKNKNFGIIKFIIYTLFFIYIINVFKYVLFPINIDGGMKEEFSKLHTPYQYFIRSLEFIPFKGVSIFEFALNILLTFPLGFFIPLLKRNISYSKIICYSFFTGVFLEGIQAFLILIQGFTIRVISVNDVIANFLGVVFGFLIFKLLYKIIIVLTNKKRLKFFKNFTDYIFYYNKKYN